MLFNNFLQLLFYLQNFHKIKISYHLRYIYHESIHIFVFIFVLSLCGQSYDYNWNISRQLLFEHISFFIALPWEYDTKLVGTKLTKCNVHKRILNC